MIPPKTDHSANAGHVVPAPLTQTDQVRPVSKLSQLERGAVATEYAIIGMLCSIAIVGGATMVGPRLAKMFTLPDNVLVP